MADWQTPKTNWQAGDIPGASDFNRAEGNSEYLKGQTDELKIYVLPSDTVILKAASGRGTQGLNWAKVKSVRLKHEGIYRVKVSIRSSESSSTARASIYVEQGTGAEGGVIVQTTSTIYTPKVLELYVPAGGVVAISINNSHGSNFTYVSNVRICGALSTRSQAPSNAVLQN